jgi:hypothetical protein
LESSEDENEYSSHFYCLLSISNHKFKEVERKIEDEYWNLAAEIDTVSYSRLENVAEEGGQKSCHPESQEHADLSDWTDLRVETNCDCKQESSEHEESEIE